jgi:hypothetical protein
MSPEIYEALSYSVVGDAYTRPVTVKETYSKSNGKFPAAYGNVALIDCHYILDYVFDYARNDYAPTLPPVNRTLFLIELNRL